MQGLFIKDILSVKKAFMPVGLIAGLFALAGLILPFVNSDESTQTAMTMTTMFIAALFVGGGYALSQAVFGADESKRWAYYVSSSPVGTNGQVASKYLFLMAVTFCSSLIAIIYDSLMMALHREYVSLIAIVYLLSAIQIFFRAIDTPFILRWGTAKGDVVKMGFILAIIFIAVLYLLFGDLSIFGSMDNFSERLIEKLKEPSVFLNSVLGWMGLISIAAFYISYRISCLLYPKGVECIGE